MTQTDRRWTDALARDIASTLGVAARIEPAGSSGDGTLELTLDADGIFDRGRSLLFHPFELQHFVIDQLGRAWPRCPVHGRHPLVLRWIDAPVWICGAEESIHFDAGHLPPEGPPDRPLPPGTVRWWQQEMGFGVVVGPNGEDAWALFSMVETGGDRRTARSLREGERVEVKLGGAEHDAFKIAATRVRTLDR